MSSSRLNPMKDFPDDASVQSIPRFTNSGRAYSEEERARIANKRGQCLKCGIRITEVRGLFKKKLTNDEVHDGICIRCNPEKVPPDALKKYEEKHVPKKMSAAKARLRAATRTVMVAAPVTSRPSLDSSSIRPPKSSASSTVASSSASTLMRDSQFDGRSSMSSFRSGESRSAVPDAATSTRLTSIRERFIENEEQFDGHGSASNLMRDSQFDGHSSMSSFHSEESRSAVPDAATSNRLTSIRERFIDNEEQFDGHNSLANMQQYTSARSHKPLSPGGEKSIRSVAAAAASPSESSTSVAWAPQFDGHLSMSSIPDEVDRIPSRQNSGRMEEKIRARPTPALEHQGSYSESKNPSTTCEGSPASSSSSSALRNNDPQQVSSSWLNYDHDVQPSSRDVVSDDFSRDQKQSSSEDIFQVLQAINENLHNAGALKQKLARLRNLSDDRGDSLQVVKSVMSEYRNDSSVLAAAIGALWSVVAAHDEKKMEAAECGTIDCILDGLRNSQTQKDVEFDAWAIGSLACLTRGRHNRGIIGNSNGIEIILGTLRDHENVPSVFEWSCRTLHSLVHQYENEDDDSEVIRRNITSIDEQGGVPIIISAMRIHYSETVAEGWAVKLLLRLLDRDNVLGVHRELGNINREDGIAACVKVLKARSTTPEVFSWTAELVANLFVEAEADNNKNAVESAADSIPTVARVMTESKDDEKLQESCCRLLSQLAGTKHKDKIMECQALGLIVNAMKVYTVNLRLQEAGSWALWAMSFDSSSFNPSYITEALDALDSSTREFRTSSFLMAGACGFVGNTCSEMQTSKCDVSMGILLRALNMNDPIDMVDEQVCRAIANLCLEVPDAVGQLFEFRALNPILDRLRRESLKVSLSACQLLMVVADTTDGNKKSLFDAGVLESALALLRTSSSPSVINDVLELIATLSAWEQRISVSLPRDSAIVILDKIPHCSTSELLVKACIALTNLLLSTAMGSTALDLDGLVESITSLIDEEAGNAVEVRQAACEVLWAFVAKQRELNDAELASMFTVVIALMKAFKGGDQPFNVELQSRAAGALEAITARIEGRSFELGPEDVDTIVAVMYMTMEYESDRTELLEKLLGVILNLSFLFDAIVIQCGGIVVVIDAMVEHEKDEVIQEIGCSILALMASTENLQVNLCIAETDGIDMIISGLASFPANEKIQMNACKALAHLSIDAESRLLIASQGGIMLVVDAMRTNGGNVDLLEGGCAALLNLSADAKEEVLTDASVIEIVIEIMRNHPDVSRLQEKGLGVLQNSSMRNSDAKRAIAGFGGIKVVASAIEEFMGSPSVLERAFTTMWSLAVLDSNQPLIASTGGVDLVVNGMMAHINSPKVQKQACGCLCTLAANSQNNTLIREAGGIDAIVYTMWVQYDSEVVLSEACRALSSVAVDAHTNEVIIASEAEVNAVISAMRRFPDSGRLQQNACLALRNLLLSSESVDVVRSSIDEIIAMVTAAASRFPAKCEDLARQILNSIT